MSCRLLILLLATLVPALLGPSLQAAEADPTVAAVTAATRRMLAAAQDASGERTGLLADGYEQATGKPLVWVYRKRKVIISNAANQGNFLRLLVALGAITDDDVWTERARSVAKAQLNRLQGPDGLMAWGGHRFFDLAKDEAWFAGQKWHELKGHYPYYDLYTVVDPDRAARAMRAFWAAHVDFGRMHFNRHGKYGRKERRTAFPAPPAKPSVRKTFRKTIVTMELPFAPTAADLVWAAGAYAQAQPGDAERAAAWSRHLLERFHAERHPETGLGGYIYSRRPKGRDRVAAQFGPEFGDAVSEATLLDVGRGFARYGQLALAVMAAAPRLGAAGEHLLERAREDLVAYGKHAWDGENGTFRSLFTDGRPIGPEDHRRDGRYTKAMLAPRPPSGMMLWAWAKAWRLTGDAALWEQLAGMLRATKVAIPTDAPGRLAAHPAATPAPAPLAVMALVELCRADGVDAPTRQVLRATAARLRATRHHHGVFLPSAQHRYVRLNDPTPLVLLHAVNQLQGDAATDLPDPSPAMGTFYGAYDGIGPWVKSASYTDRRISDAQLYAEVVKEKE